MNLSHLIFNAEQLNRVFPYYILLNDDLGIDAFGAAYKSIIKGIASRSNFTELFTVGGKTRTQYNDIVDLAGTYVTLLPLGNSDIKFQGQLEYLEATGQFLFAGNTLKGIAPVEHTAPNSTGVLKGRINFYEDVLNEVPADIVVFDNQHRYLFVSETAMRDNALRERMIGLKDEDYCWLTNMPEEQAKERQTHFNKVLKSKKLESWEEKLVNTNGNTTYHLRNMYPVLDEDNHVKLVIGYGLDITERKHVEEKLLVNEKKYHDLYNFGTALIYTHDLKGKILSVNPAISNTLGFTQDEVLNTNILDLLPAYDRKKMQREYIDKLNTEGTVKGMCRALHKNGKDVTYLYYQGHVATDNSTDPYIIGFSQDITDRIKIEKELRAAKITTENSARAKEIFLANMSHEIRTPMNGILGLNMLLSKTELNEQQQGYTRLISESVKNLLNIVNDILDIEKIGSGKLELENKPFNITNKITRTLQLFQYKLKEKNLNLIVNNRLPEEFSVIGDQYRFAQILSNLISNAIKFTKKGNITVSASLLYNSNDKVLLEFAVKDTGIGINPERLPLIFDPFVQGSNNITRKYGGTGLGLSICKSLIEIQGGHIKVNTKLNQGTEFIFSLTYKKGQAFIQKQNEDTSMIDPERLKGKKILVAEDVELNQFLVKNLLESWGCTVTIANNGIEAVEEVKENLYDLVLMDIQMPEMDGITATRHIRQLSTPNKSVPIVAFTANALKGDSQYYIDEGMNDCVIKPYTEEELYQKLIDVLKRDGKSVDITLTPDEDEPDNEETDDGHKEEDDVTEDAASELEAGEHTGKLYDLTMIETISKNNRSFVNKMILMFCEITAQDFDKLKEAAEEDNWETVSQIAHKLKSTVGNMGVESLKEVLRVLEFRTSDQPGKLVDELESKLNEVRKQLKENHPDAFETAPTS